MLYAEVRNFPLCRTECTASGMDAVRAMESVFEAAATQEFPQQGCQRDFLVLYRCEVFDELHEPVGFGVFGAVARHAGKYGFRMAAQYGKLE